MHSCPTPAEWLTFRAMTHYTGPLLVLPTLDAMRTALAAGHTTWRGSLDLGRSQCDVELGADAFSWNQHAWPYPEKLKDRTIYFRGNEDWEPAARFSGTLIKLVPTDWGAPTFEIDGIKMLPTSRLSPFDDAQRKVALIAPAGKTVLDTCGGLGYFAAHCLAAGAARILSFEKNADVLWLRRLNPWSPDPDAVSSAGRLHLTHGDVSEQIASIPNASVDAMLHDPPRFGIAGELYSQTFYDHLARVLRPQGRLFHYTGTPNRLTSGRDVPREVARRLEKSGFKTELALDGVLGIRHRHSTPR